jgi:hypothetical protein
VTQAFRGDQDSIVLLQSVFFASHPILSGFVGQPLLAAAGLLAGFFGRGMLLCAG